jgi:hypothetical protein
MKARCWALKGLLGNSRISIFNANKGQEPGLFSPPGNNKKEISSYENQIFPLLKTKHMHHYKGELNS